MLRTERFGFEGLSFSDTARAKVEQGVDGLRNPPPFAVGGRSALRSLDPQNLHNCPLLPHHPITLSSRIPGPPALRT